MPGAILCGEERVVGTGWAAGPLHVTAQGPLGGGSLLGHRGNRKAAKDAAFFSRRPARLSQRLQHRTLIRNQTPG